MVLNILNSFLRVFSNALNIPVIVLLCILIAVSVFLLGSLVVEFFTERRKLNCNLPALVDKLQEIAMNETGSERNDALKEEINNAKLLKCHKRVLNELLNHSDVTDSMREALAFRLLDEEKARFEKIVKISDVVAKLGPILGLMGTLIPLGPGIVALGQGDTFTLSSSLQTAFDTTIAGLSAAAVSMVISLIRKKWYTNYVSILELLMECVLEVAKNDK